MSGWTELYALLSRTTEAERSAHAARAAFDGWCQRAEAEVMSALHRGASRRAEEVRDRAGVALSVRYPAQPEWARPAPDVRLRVLGLSLSGHAVDLYSHRTPGAHPFVHLAHVRPPTSASRFPVVVSLPGCRVDRTPEDGFALSDVSTPGVVARPVTADALLLRAFTILVNAAAAGGWSPQPGRT